MILCAAEKMAADASQTRNQQKIVDPTGLCTAGKGGACSAN